MCTRSVRRVMQLDIWMNAAWRLSFRQIHTERWQFFLRLVWYHSPKFCLSTSSLIYLLLSHLTVISKQQLHLLPVIQPDLDSRPFAWCVPPLHIDRQVIMSHNSVTEIKKTLTHSKIGTQIAFHRDITSKIQVCLFNSPLTQEPSPCLSPNSISISWLAGEAICRCKRLHVQQASLLEWVQNPAPWPAQDWVYSSLTAAS